MSRFTTAGALLILLGVFFSASPVLVMLGVASILALMLAGLQQAPRLDRLAAPVLVNYLYWLGSGFFSGAFSPSDLFNLDMIGGEGRIFLYYIPLLAFCVLRLDLAILPKVRQVLMVLVALGVVLLVLVSAAPDIGDIGHNGLLHGFTSSHHVLGFLYGILAIFFVFECLDGKWRSVPAVLISSAMIIASGSRTTLVALALVATWILLQRKNIKAVVGILAAGTAAFAAGIHFSEPFQRRVVGVVSMDTLGAMVSQFSYTSNTFESGVQDAMNREIIEGEHNIVVRVALWASAFKNFQNSPIVGMGFGRPNDDTLRFSGMRGLIWVATDGERKFSESTAHNSYFQVAQETGLVGLLLLGWIWWALYARLARIKRDWRSLGDRVVSRYAEAGQAMIIFALGCSMTGHALGSPAIGLPLMVLTGIVVAADRTARLQGRSVLSSYAAPRGAPGGTGVAVGGSSRV